MSAQSVKLLSKMPLKNRRLTNRLIRSERMKIDFHVHTKYSPDALGSAEEIAEVLKKENLIVAITDHNSIEMHAHLRKEGVKFIPGEEILTSDGEVIALFINELIKPHLSFEETAEKIREQGGLIYIPHMYDWRRKVIKNEAYAKKADIIEGFNAKCEKNCNLAAQNFALKENKPMGAGSDAHLVYEIGSCFVEIEDFDLDSPKELLKNLRKGKIVDVSKPRINFLPSVIKFFKKVFI